MEKSASKAQQRDKIEHDLRTPTYHTNFRFRQMKFGSVQRNLLQQIPSPEYIRHASVLELSVVLNVSRFG